MDGAGRNFRRRNSSEDQYIIVVFAMINRHCDPAQTVFELLRSQWRDEAIPTPKHHYKEAR